MLSVRVPRTQRRRRGTAARYGDTEASPGSHQRQGDSAALAEYAESLTEVLEGLGIDFNLPETELNAAIEAAAARCRPRGCVMPTCDGSETGERAGLPGRFPIRLDGDAGAAQRASRGRR